MSRAYSIVSNTTVGDRLLYVGQAAVQLSTGDCVFLATDPSQSNPNKVSLYVATGAARGTESLIATLGASTALGTIWRINYAKPQCLALCRDQYDNLYVVGAYGGTSTTTLIAYQAFLKQSGLVWQPAVANVCTTGASAAIPPVGYVAVWVNTGGTAYPPITGSAAGQLLIAANTNDGSVTNVAYVLDAGKILAGVSQHGNVVVNPAFVGDSATLYGSNCDITATGFGTTSGMCISAVGTSACQVSSWGVSATGALTTGLGLSATFPTGTLTTTTKLRIAWNAALNWWVVAFPSASNAGQITVLSPVFTGTQTSVDTGTASNFPASSGSLSWDLSTDPGGDTWIYGWSSATATTMLRIPVTFPAGVPTLGAVVSDDTGVGSTSSTIRTTKEPVDWFHADWQSYDTASPYSLEGDYSVLPVVPYAPVLVSPLNNAAAPFAGGGTFDWNNLTSPETSDAQVTYYLRFHTAAGYQWWNGSALTTAQVNPTGGNEVAVTSGTSSATLGSSILSTGAWSWSVQVTGASGVVSGYSTSWIVNVAAQPTVPSLSATYDSANNRVTLGIGGGLNGDLAWVEYTDDSVNWYNVRGCTAVLLVGGVATVYDWEPPALTPETRTYRALRWIPSNTPALNYSAWSSYATATWPIPAKFTLRAPLLMTVGVQAHVLAGTLTTAYGENLTEHNPLGNPETVIVADVVGLEDGGCTFFTETATDEAALLALLLSQQTLLFQTTDGRAWFTRWNAPRPVNTPYLVATNNHREHAVTWRGQVRPPA